MKGFASLRAIVHKEPVTTSFNVRLSHPASKEQSFKVIIDESVLTEYNTRTGQSHVALPKEQFELQTKEVKIAQGAVISDDVKIQVLAPSKEMKDSGKSYALGLRIEGDANLLKGADRIVVLIDQPAIQSVMQFNSRSNVELKLNEEIELRTWTLEYFVNIDRLGKQIKQLNNQAIFGAWGPGTNGRNGEIYTRFGDAPIEGNRFQVKNKGTQMNSKQLFEENKWYHIAIVCSETKLELYVNGTLDNELVLPAGTIWINKTFSLGNTDYLRANVKIAQLRLWDVARTPAQIKGSMTKVDPKTEGLVAYWRFDEGQGDTFKDATGKNPDAVTKNNGHVTWVQDVKLD